MVYDSGDLLVDYRLSRPDNIILNSLLNNFISLRNGQDQVLWSVIGAFWTSNSVLLVCVFSAFKDNLFFVGLLVSIIGVSTSFVWHIVQERAVRRIKYYEIVIRRIENELDITDEFSFFLNYNSFSLDTKTSFFNMVLTARNVMHYFSLLILCAWILWICFLVFSVIIF